MWLPGKVHAATVAIALIGSQVLGHFAESSQSAPRIELMVNEGGRRHVATIVNPTREQTYAGVIFDLTCQGADAKAHVIRGMAHSVIDERALDQRRRHFTPDFEVELARRLEPGESVRIDLSLALPPSCLSIVERPTLIAFWTFD